MSDSIFDLLTPTMHRISGTADERHALHPTLPHIVLFTQPACTRCNATKRSMRRMQYTPLIVDITEDNNADLYQWAKNELDITQMPIVAIHNIGDPNNPESVYWSDFRYGNEKVAGSLFLDFIESITNDEDDAITLLNDLNASAEYANDEDNPRQAFVDRATDAVFYNSELDLNL